MLSSYAERSLHFAPAFAMDSGMAKPTVLIIRDGWGIHPDQESDPENIGDTTRLAKTPVHDALYRNYPGSQLNPSGLEVGLPEGQMGNSEVGHLNLGAGRVVYQELTRINKAIEEGELESNPALCAAFEKARNHRLHLIGLVSDGGVHSHQDHLVALGRAASKAGLKDVMLHAITDGRDTSPTSGADSLRFCLENLPGISLGTIVGRYFAMDRDNRWDRTQKAWNAIVLGEGESGGKDPVEAVRKQYSEGITDEFLPPLLFDHRGEQRIRDDDVTLFFNFRADRARQLSQAFLLENFAGFDRKVWPRVHYVTLTRYDKTYDCPVLFEPAQLERILGEVVSEAGLKQLRIAETEKYPHVTYFFNGGVEQAFPGEERVIVPSPKVATYDLQPEMSAEEVTREVLARLKDFDLIILNFANPDMVGHTGDLSAAIKAVEAIDDCVGRVVDAVLEAGGRCLVTADHGNCEQMKQTDGSPHTAHTTNPVHCLLVASDADKFQLRDGILADVAPTLLDLLGVAKPAEMTGESLVSPRQG